VTYHRLSLLPRADDEFNLPAILKCCYDADAAHGGRIAMRFSSDRIRSCLRQGVVILLVSLPMSCIAQVSELLPFAPTQGGAKVTSPPQIVPPCASIPSNSSAGHSASQSKSGAHSVTLSWNASIPRSSTKDDAILGYYVYRSSTSNSYDDSNQLNSEPLPGTQCIDRTVAPRGKYFYVVRAIAGNKKKSGNSNEAPATIPFP